MEKNNNNGEIHLEIKPEIARGTYSNLAIISHSPSEFIIDFATILPGMAKPDITDRIVMTPENTKRLAIMLHENIMKYEHDFGEIPLHVEPAPAQEPAPGTDYNLGNMGKGGNLS